MVVAMVNSTRLTDRAHQPLPFVPRRFADETLWSWITRIALYYEWAADDFLAILLEDNHCWAVPFHRPDVDVEPPNSLLTRLSTITNIPVETLESWRLAPASSTLWMDDRTAFCPDCWDSPGGALYIRVAWLDAWTVDCEIHRRPLISIRSSRRAWRLADWSVAWGSQRRWALAAHVPQYPREVDARVEVPPTFNAMRHTAAVADDALDIPMHVRRPDSAFERELVLMAGHNLLGFSIARVYYDLEDDLQWRNIPHGFDWNRPLTQPLGPLSLRACAIRIGSVLFDLLSGAVVRDPATANALCTLLSELRGRPRLWLTSKVAAWQTEHQMAWLGVFGWPTKADYRQAAKMQRRGWIIRRPRGRRWRCSVRNTQARRR